MNVQVVQGDIGRFDADTLVVNLFEGVAQPGGATGAVDGLLDGAISELIANGDLTGKLGEVRAIYPRRALPAQRVLVVGLGSAEKFDATAARRAAAAAAKYARDCRAAHLATIVHGGGIGRLDLAAAAQATVEGNLLALYRYEAVRRKPLPHHVDRLTVVEFAADKLAAIEAATARARAVGAGVTLARDLVQGPPNEVTPKHMARTALSLANQFNMKITVGGRKWAAERNMGAFLGVAQGAGHKPRFIVLEHNPTGSDEPPVVLVGKGITFDTGGISIKPTQPMWEMKGDMGGAAAVMGTLRAIAELGLPRRVVGIMPCTENMPDAHAYRPSDILTASNGTTIEILSTDAEGRLILADALVYAQRYQPLAVIDLATLTGSASIAMGDGMAAPFYCNDDALADRVLAAGSRTHERVWRMPLWDDYIKFIESEVADLKNSGLKPGGLGASAIFLRAFTDYSWAHIDIAGVAFTQRVNEYTYPGATGYGVRLLVDMLLNWS